MKNIYTILLKYLCSILALYREQKESCKNWSAGHIRLVRTGRAYMPATIRESAKIISFIYVIIGSSGVTIVVNPAGVETAIEGLNLIRTRVYYTVPFPLTRDEGSVRNSFELF